MYTEAPFTGKYWNEKRKGMYVCSNCGLELFSSDTKFDSGSGWPSFDAPVNKEHVKLIEDVSHGTVRTEVVCARCGEHLGHVFDDLPAGRQVVLRADGKPAGKRFCINSCDLDLKEHNKEEK